MKKLIHLLFSHRLENRKWFHVIGWWELRRIAFNAIILLSGLISLICFYFVVVGAYDFIIPLAPILFGFVANFFYTGGWLLELFLRLFKGINTDKIAIRLYKIGLIITIVGTFLPTIIFGVIAIVEGERRSSPYSHFAHDKPNFQQLSGVYNLDSESEKYLNESDKSAHGNIALNNDSTFIATNLPIFNYCNEYDLCCGTGRWKIDQNTSYRNPWTIDLIYDTLTTKKTNQSYRKYSREFHIYNNKPPYKLCDVVGDPDSWINFIYEKK